MFAVALHSKRRPGDDTVVL